SPYRYQPLRKHDAAEESVEFRASGELIDVLVFARCPSDSPIQQLGDERSGQRDLTIKEFPPLLKPLPYVTLKSLYVECAELLGGMQLLEFVAQPCPLLLTFSDRGRQSIHLSGDRYRSDQPGLFGFHFANLQLQCSAFRAQGLLRRPKLRQRVYDGCSPQKSLIAPLRQPLADCTRDGGRRELASRRLDSHRAGGGRSAPLLDQAEDPEAQVPSSNAGGRGCTPRQQNAHIIEQREVLYRWHPWHGRTVSIVAAMTRGGLAIFRCHADDRSRALEIPQWMFDPATCCRTHLAARAI